MLKALLSSVSIIIRIVVMNYISNQKLWPYIQKCLLIYKIQKTGMQNRPFSQFEGYMIFKTQTLNIRNPVVNKSLEQYIRVWFETQQ